MTEKPILKIKPNHSAPIVNLYRGEKPFGAALINRKSGAIKFRPVMRRF